jgi:hypothetical protein
MARWFVDECESDAEVVRLAIEALQGGWMLPAARKTSAPKQRFGTSSRSPQDRGSSS